MKTKIKLVELFGGIGSQRKAMENILGKENVEIKLYVDFEKTAVDAYNKLFNDNQIPTDIKNVKGSQIENVDILFHSSPCQDFSIAGKRDMSLGRSILYKETIRILKECKNKPKIVIWENVASLNNKDNLRYWHDYVANLNLMFYETHRIKLNAKDFGLAQNRERLFTISFLDTNITRQENKQWFSKIMSLYNYKKEEKPLRKFIDLDEDTFIKLPNIENFIEHKHYINIPFKNGNINDTSNYSRIWKYDNYVGAITTKINKKILIPIEFVKTKIEQYQNVTINNFTYAVRYLSQKECFRLMGWKDKDFNLLNGTPKIVLQKLIGNSIAIPVLEYIFRKLVC